jgi:hypothetical protein
MYTAQAPPRPVHRRFPGGPPLAGLTATSTALFLAGLIASTAMAGTTFPSTPATDAHPGTRAPRASATRTVPTPLSPYPTHQATYPPGYRTTRGPA